MFRIISGKWKAKKIAAPKNFQVRPTTDFAKEALFSMLENRYDFAFCTVLDLFAGIGSISLEFASRGCPAVTSVEMNVKHTAFIHRTAQELELSRDIDVQRADVFDWLKRNRGRGKSFDIIFADPPFDLEPAKYSELIALVLHNDFLKENGLFVLEHQSRLKPEGFQPEDTRKYGNVSFSLFRKEAAEEAVEDQPL